MTHSGGKPYAVGDKGQRYEIWCKVDDHGTEMQIGYSDNPESFKNMVEKHPVWHSRRVVDRHATVSRPLSPPIEKTSGSQS